MSAKCAVCPQPVDSETVDVCYYHRKVRSSLITETRSEGGVTMTAARLERATELKSKRRSTKPGHCERCDASLPITRTRWCSTRCRQTAQRAREEAARSA